MSKKDEITEYGRPTKHFFIEIQNFWAWADKLGRKNAGAFGVFSAELSAPILVQWPFFPKFNYYFYKKLSFSIHIPNIYLGLGFEFGPQRAFVCP